MFCVVEEVVYNIRDNLRGTTTACTFSCTYLRQLLTRTQLVAIILTNLPIDTYVAVDKDRPTFQSGVGNFGLGPRPRRYRVLVSCPDHAEKRVVWEHCYFKFVLPLMRFIHFYVHDACYFLSQL